MNNTNHAKISSPDSIDATTPFQILSRVIPSQKFLILASIQLIKSRVNASVQMLRVIEMIFVTKFGITDSPFVHINSPNNTSITQIPKKIPKIISEINKNVHALPYVREISHHSLRISENEISLFVFVCFCVIF